jgi:hypothetical protein
MSVYECPDCHSDNCPSHLKDMIADLQTENQKFRQEASAAESNDAECVAREWYEREGNHQGSVTSSVEKLAALLRERDQVLVTSIAAWLRNHAADDFFYSS